MSWITLNEVFATLALRLDGIFNSNVYWLCIAHERNAPEYLEIEKEAPLSLLVPACDAVFGFDSFHGPTNA